eukprot:TRINITY_DN19837_c0_g1_i1.p1 TRINITY_DN19837_c0_g1~~TRINITY_DN19837_c0_g1_i1.p1  ORF type:complete len:630 (+),score=146.11 TRINITY_DN19837_c0_g1_i1:93-1982(+)
MAEDAPEAEEADFGGDEAAVEQVEGDGDVADYSADAEEEAPAETVPAEAQAVASESQAIGTTSSTAAPVAVATAATTTTTTTTTTAATAPSAATLAAVTAAAPRPVGLAAPKVVTGVAAPMQAKKVLVVGDENFLFSAGLQEAYPQVQFTAVSALGRPTLDHQQFESSPQILQNRARHNVDPTRLAQSFGPHAFDGVLLFLPGLSYSVPKELKTADRPLFAYRTHHLVFNILKQIKVLLKAPEGLIHLVWPQDAELMSSPCGSAGIEMVKLLSSLGCKKVEAQFSMEKMKKEDLTPIIFGEVPKEVPFWLHGAAFHSFICDTKPIELPLCVALQLPPDMGHVSIKDASPSPGVAPSQQATAILKSKLFHEATARRARLKEIYGSKHSPEEGSICDNLVMLLAEQDCPLSIPTEIFTTPFDQISHISNIFKFNIFGDAHPVVQVTNIEMLDPRLPTRVVRISPAQSQSAASSSQKRVREADSTNEANKRPRTVVPGTSAKGAGKKSGSTGQVRQVGQQNRPGQTGGDNRGHGDSKGGTKGGDRGGKGGKSTGFNSSGGKTSLGKASGGKAGGTGKASGKAGPGGGDKRDAGGKSGGKAGGFGGKAGGSGGKAGGSGGKAGGSGSKGKGKK